MYSYNTLRTSREAFGLVGAEKFKEKYGTEPQFVSVAPGRINIIGEHTDYIGGNALPAAINRYTCFAFSLQEPESGISIHSCDLDKEFSMRWDTEIEFVDWERYVGGCVKVFREKYGKDFGLNGILCSNIPMGAGLSSSAALECAILNGLNRSLGTNIWDLEIAKMGQKIEHQYLGVSSGLMDQMACMMSKKNHALFINFSLLDREYDDSRGYIDSGPPLGLKCQYRNVPFREKNYVWVVVDSKIKHSLGDSEYNKRVEECNRALEIIKEKEPSVRNFRNLTAYHMYWLEDNKLFRRIEHGMTENDRVEEAVWSMREMDRLGGLLKLSHRSLRDLYEVSCKELDILVEICDNLEGCQGSRMMGGGFGGSVLALVCRKNVDTFIQCVKKSYREKTDLDCDAWELELVDGAGK